MPISRRNLLISGASVGAVSAAGMLGWELSKLETKARILIAGGGAAGISIANKLQMHLKGAHRRPASLPLVPTRTNTTVSRGL